MTSWQVFFCVALIHNIIHQVSLSCLLSHKNLFALNSVFDKELKGKINFSSDILVS